MSERPHEGDLDTTPVPPTGDMRTTYNGGSGEGTPVGAERVHVAPHGVRGGSSEGTGVYPERAPNKELNNELNRQPKNNVIGNSPSARVPSDDVFIVGRTESECNPLEDEMLEWAKSHKFWGKFTRPPHSRFIKGCLESETFRKHFVKARKKTATRVPSPAQDEELDMEFK